MKKRFYKENIYYFVNQYDPAGNVNQQVYAHIDTAQEKMNYGYDDFYRLEEFKYNDQTVHTYSYDPNGNLKTFGGRTFTYGNQNNQMTNDGTRTFLFDAVGRVKSIGSTTITYDILNNMTSAGSDVYKYDSFGQRILKIEDSGQIKTFYITSGSDVLAEYDKQDGLMAEYVYGPSGIVAKIDPAQGYLWFYKDHLGSLRHMNIDNMRIDYYPYGQRKTVAGDETNYQFTGKELDTSTGLTYFGAKYYDPSIGRWYIPDPAGQGWSPYVYGGNRPLIMVDPNGEFAWFALAVVLSNAYMGGRITQGNGGNFWEGFALSAATSLASMGVSSALTSAFGTPVGFAGGFVRDATTNYVMGGILSGGDFNSPGNLFSTFTGGVMGGVNAGNRSVAMGNNFWTGAERRLNTSLPDLLEMDHSVSLDRRRLQVVMRTYRSRTSFNGNQFSWFDEYSDGTWRFEGNWQAQSGPWGPQINVGTWTAYDVTNDPRLLEPGMIRDGVGWKVFLEDQFGREGMRIHPDGIPPDGTLGCIGIQENADRLINLYNRFENYFNIYSRMDVIVNY